MKFISIITICFVGMSVILNSQENDKNYFLSPIITSATKFSQNYHEVSGSVLSVSGKELEDLSISNTTQLEKIFPGLQLKVGNGAGYVGGAIRGLGTTLFRNARLAIYVDGIPQDSAFLSQELSDVKSVEMLRGPQGTLYGVGSYAGLINIITHNIDSPILRIRGKSEVSYLSENITLSASSPVVSGWFYAGGNFAYVHNNGMLTDISRHQRVDNGDTWSGTGSLAFVPDGSGFKALFKYSHYILRDNHYIFYILQDAFDKKDLDIATGSFIPYNNTNTQTYSLRIEQKIGQSILSNTTSYQDYDFGWHPSKTYFAYEKRKNVNEELRLSTLYDNGGYSIFGFYYQYGGFKSTSGADTNTYNHTIALYGEGKMVFGNFDATLGLRYNFNRSLLDYEGDAINPSLNGDFIQHILTPKLALGYTLNENNRFYTLYSSGYSPGGFLYYASNATAAKPYKAELSHNLEIGIYSSLWGNKVDLSADIYGIYITDKQIFITNPDEVNRKFLSNAGNAYSAGLEFSIKSIPIPSLMLSLGGAFGHAAFIKAEDPITKQNYNNKTLVFAPNASVNANINWNFINIAKAKFFLNLNGNFYSKIYFQDDDNENSAQKPYFLLDTALRMEYDKFVMNLSIGNVFNEFYNRYAWDYGASGVRHYIGDVRNIGLSLRYEL
ncbi:TonB-dependent receptor plug domain-containing protein [Helicobacter sp. 13S00477-4]|uniref:TonB-dependent receptor n=1 Tax=Helicobacter sp. 13S00477-4 TaxID=1905759 RepID=UPI000BA4F5F8|nr:TonB-dependent receptor plug domain-containing protein [Helicobacter sp. 13S00477-4]PAF52472.1 hypothetical protein BKH44_01440 [Helicobacter sp. 13S00477-4]